MIANAVIVVLTGVRDIQNAVSLQTIDDSLLTPADSLLMGGDCLTGIAGNDVADDGSDPSDAVCDIKLAAHDVSDGESLTVFGDLRTVSRDFS
jgi:hypothetical protein